MSEYLPPTSAEKGSDLERRIAAYFRDHGYTATTNEVFVGRSGGRHEIDVFAEFDDGVTSYRVAIECKAWQAPIDKEVVAKAAYVCADLGITKVIIVSLHGWQVGAELAAKQQGVELWGPSELQQRLGRVPMAAAMAGPTRRIAQGFPITVDRSKAEKFVTVERWGFFRPQAEKIEGIPQIWLPIWLLEIAYSREERHKLRTLRTWNVYEALTGSFLMKFPAAPQLSEVDIGRSRLVHRINAKGIGRRLVNAAQKSWTLVTASAQQRYEDELEYLGVPRDAKSVSMEMVIEAYLPVFAGFLIHNGSQRVMAIDATWGRLWPNLGAVLTANAGYVKEAIEG